MTDKKKSFDRLIGLAYYRDSGSHNKEVLNELLLEEGLMILS